ncbi:MAG: CotH kinase family protein [Bacteroidales bacterium]|nr:CotH kinase family protein [Bacteroidales bacterium]
MNRCIPGIALFLTLLAGSHPAHAQVIHPDAGFLFDDAGLPRIDLTISGSNFQSLYADPESNTEYYAVFNFTRGDSTVGPLGVGLRFRGDTIRNKEKKSFRISFNSMDAGADLHGIEKMDLNAEVNDPSLIRSKLGWELFRYLGVPGSRSNHVLLYINNDFFGIYLNTEHIDERFTKSRFDNNDGNLYRNLWPADLAYLGASPEVYKYEYDGRRAYALRKNEKWDDYEDLALLIGTLDQYSGESLKGALEGLINVQQFLKVLAVDMITGNWDGYSGDKNNYYLYRDQVSGRFEYIPYNLENSVGIDFRGVDWSTRSIYNWNLNLRPLYEKILEVEQYRDQFTAYVRGLAAYVVSATFNNELLRWRDQIRPFVGLDSYYTRDWGFSSDDFEAALTGGWGSHVTHGVQEFLLARSASALTEAIQVDAFPLFSHVRVKPRQGRIDLDWTVEDENPDAVTALHYRIDGGGWTTRLRSYPDLTDPVSGSSTYLDTLFSLADTTSVELYFTATDLGGQETRYPDTTLLINFPLIAGPLYINEFVASNQTVKSDEYGEFDDWVEIYNASDTPVWLADYYLSDNMGSPGKYRFPEEFLPAGGFYLVWLDDQEEQGVNHATFKISKEGEELRLSERPSTGYHLVDSVTFELQEQDVSMGRLVDGGLEWIAFTSPTPRYSNLSTGEQDQPAPREPLSIFPNPVSEGVFHFNKRVSGAIYKLSGQKMMELVNTERAQVPQLNPGVYIFRSAEGESVKIIVSR